MIVIKGIRFAPDGPTVSSTPVPNKVDSDVGFQIPLLRFASPGDPPTLPCTHACTHIYPNEPLCNGHSHHFWDIRPKARSEKWPSRASRAKQVDMGPNQRLSEFENPGTAFIRNAAKHRLWRVQFLKYGNVIWCVLRRRTSVIDNHARDSPTWADKTNERFTR